MEMAGRLSVKNVLYVPPGVVIELRVYGCPRDTSSVWGQFVSKDQCLDGNAVFTILINVVCLSVRSSDPHVLQSGCRSGG